MITEFAPAKVNLTLHVTGQRDDGYHLLNSLVVFADVGDEVTVTPADDLSLTVSGPFAKGVPTDETNLVMRAARLLSPGAKAAIHLVKNLPHGGGIGGGSSDAAATLRALSRLLDLPLPRPSETLSIGADLPVCMHAPTPMIMSGIGEVLSPSPALHGGYLVLVNPRVEVPTGKVFSALRTGYGLTDLPMTGMAELENAKDIRDVGDWLQRQRNDLTKCASDFAPQIGPILELFRENAACLDTDMSGSGSTCWGLFETEHQARDCARTFRAAHPGYWVSAAAIFSADD